METGEENAANNAEAPSAVIAEGGDAQCEPGGPAGADGENEPGEAKEDAGQEGEMVTVQESVRGSDGNDYFVGDYVLVHNAAAPDGKPNVMQILNINRKGTDLAISCATLF